MNKYQEALKTLKEKGYTNHFQPITLEHQYPDEFKILQELVYKATPRKTKEIEENDIVAGKILNFNCPECNHNLFVVFIDLNRVAKYKSNYCERCGQALDWSDEDDR